MFLYLNFTLIKESPLLALVKQRVNVILLPLGDSYQRESWTLFVRIKQSSASRGSAPSDHEAGFEPEYGTLWSV